MYSFKMRWKSISIFIILGIFVSFSSANMTYGNETVERYLDPVAKRMGRQVNYKLAQILSSYILFQLITIDFWMDFISILFTLSHRCWKMVNCGLLLLNVDMVPDGFIGTGTAINLQVIMRTF